MTEIKIPKLTQNRLLGLQSAIAQLQEQYNALASTILEMGGVEQDKMNGYVMADDCSKLVKKDE